MARAGLGIGTVGVIGLGSLALGLLAGCTAGGPTPGPSAMPTGPASSGDAATTAPVVLGCPDESVTEYQVLLDLPAERVSLSGPAVLYTTPPLDDASDVLLAEPTAGDPTRPGAMVLDGVEVLGIAPADDGFGVLYRDGGGSLESQATDQLAKVSLDGTVAWTTPLPRPDEWDTKEVAVVGDQFYGVHDGQITAVDWASGAVGETTDGSAVPRRDLSEVQGSGWSDVWAFTAAGNRDWENGSWSFYAGDWTITFDDDEVGETHRMSGRSTSGEVWSRDVPGATPDYFTCGDVLYGAFDDMLYVLDPATGEQLGTGASLTGFGVTSGAADVVGATPLGLVIATDTGVRILGAG